MQGNLDSESVEGKNYMYEDKVDSLEKFKVNYWKKRKENYEKFEKENLIKTKYLEINI